MIVSRSVSFPTRLFFDHSRIISIPVHTWFLAVGKKLAPGQEDGRKKLVEKIVRISPLHEGMPEISTLPGQGAHGQQSKLQEVLTQPFARPQFTNLILALPETGTRKSFTHSQVYRLVPAAAVLAIGAAEPIAARAS
jgi:hypothetical protein